MYYSVNMYTVSLYYVFICTVVTTDIAYTYTVVHIASYIVTLTVAVAS